jgi:uncharacterized protein (TIGR02246 family)
MVFFSRVARAWLSSVGRGAVFPITLPAALLVASMWAAASPAAEAPAATRAADEAAIRAAAKAYLAALDQGDAEKLAALWTPDGDIVDAMGNRMVGREAVSLEKERGGPGAAGRPEFQIHETNLRFLSDEVAIEDGTVEVTPDAGQPLTGRFSATWVKHEGTWKLAALREARGGEVSGVEALADLEWMVGDWVVVEDSAGPGAEGRPVIEVSTRWNDSKTFLNRVMTITHSPDAPPLQITQRIGWDPLTETIRSWVFGSDGSHGEATWTRDGRSWVAQARAVMIDGSQSTSLNIYTYDGKDRCGWRSLPTHVGSEHVPPVNMTMIRKPPAGGNQPGGDK